MREKSSTKRTAPRVAIVGMAGRFPGAENLAQYWRNVASGHDSISFPDDAELRRLGVDAATLANPWYVRAASALENVELFDAQFFGISEREAELIDPQQRLFLECAWEALENAGYNPAQEGGLVGVYGGSSLSSYLLINLASHPELLNVVGPFLLGTSNNSFSLTTRVSYKLNLKGPSISVQTACSTSLVAVHLACQSLLTYECDMALAGGVSVQVPQGVGYLYQEGGVLSRTGRCRAFDAQADGTVFGSGVGVVVLKRLEDAVSEGDTIRGVILGSAVNNDGAKKVGYTAPNLEAQAEVIVEALGSAGVKAESIGYVEAHGTGTVLGDPIEVAALSKAFAAEGKTEGECWLGSVKSNIGHLDAAAGVAGLIKTVLAVEQGELPPSLHYQTANPKIDFAGGPFRVNTELRKWEGKKGGKRRAGVSSFGMGGTNAHVIVEEAPKVEIGGEEREWQLLLVSARSEAGVEEAVARLGEDLGGAGGGAKLADVAFTLQSGRGEFEHRRMVVCRNVEEGVEGLRQGRDGVGVVEQSRSEKVGFLFPGQGAQYVGMGWELYQKERVFREQVESCWEWLKREEGIDLEQVIRGETEAGKIGGEAAEEKLKQT